MHLSLLQSCTCCRCYKVLFRDCSSAFLCICRCFSVLIESSCSSAIKCDCYCAIKSMCVQDMVCTPLAVCTASGGRDSSSVSSSWCSARVLVRVTCGGCMGSLGTCVGAVPWLSSASSTLSCLSVGLSLAVRVCVSVLGSVAMRSVCRSVPVRWIGAVSSVLCLRGWCCLLGVPPANATLIDLVLFDSHDTVIPNFSVTLKNVPTIFSNFRRPCWVRVTSSAYAT